MLAEATPHGKPMHRFRTVAFGWCLPVRSNSQPHSTPSPCLLRLRLLGEEWTRHLRPGPFPHLLLFCCSVCRPLISVTQVPNPVPLAVRTGVSLTRASVAITRGLQPEMLAFCTESQEPGPPSCLWPLTPGPFPTHADPGRLWNWLGEPGPAWAGDWPGWNTSLLAPTSEQHGRVS